ncbi:GGDEF domain-containing protein [Trinickia dinghuensis]|uniref:diguanylate cyclase n=1 Tax=Trinickia dinghuensis TaxID=2291023 RepID=A0A3D8K456_9BURK|nr:GGDEF domain-containing protein [Trinickia dinghuensis]RDV00010.1 GGDEF domain-containing protein [Trinickia dinghuensis]
MTSEDRSDNVRHEAASRRMRRIRGRRAKTIEAPEDNYSFEDYAAHRLWSFLCAQLATALVGYVVLLAGDAWLDKQRMAPAALTSALPALPMAAALVIAWSKGSGLRASLAALAFIASLEAGIVLHALQWGDGTLIVLPAFVLIPLTFSPVLLRGWDFPAAAALAVAGPLALVALSQPSAVEQFGIVLSMFIAISTSLVTNLFALRSQKKSFRLERQLRAFADIDELTQLPRRRRVFELGRRILLRAERVGQPFSVLYIDADHFKAVNDRFGHEAGDRALQLIAQHIQHSMRPSDVAGRFGGEEFVVLLPGTDEQDAARVAERLRRRIEDWRQFEITLTISVGVAQHVRGEPIERVIRRADAALLDAKGSGRNRVVIAERPADAIVPIKDAETIGMADLVRDHVRADAANDSLAVPGREPLAD